MEIVTELVNKSTVEKEVIVCGKVRDSLDGVVIDILIMGDKLSNFFLSNLMIISCCLSVV